MRGREVRDTRTEIRRNKHLSSPKLCQQVHISSRLLNAPILFQMCLSPMGKSAVHFPDGDEAI